MLVIAYSGTLGYHASTQVSKPDYLAILKSFIWTYRHNFHLSKTRSAFSLFKAVQILAKSYQNGGMPLKVLLWGKIDMRYLDLARRMNISDYIEIDGFLPKEESLKRLSNSDILFLPIESGSSRHNTLFIPGKVFEYLQFRKPILFDDKDSDCARIISESGLGIMSARNDAESMARGIRELMMNRELLSQFKPDEEYIRKLSFRFRAQEIASIFNRVQ